MFADIAVTTLLLLCLVSFTAGFIDAIVGGGGLLQVPCSLLLLPQLPVATVIGTLKIPAFSGTSMAAYQYIKKHGANFKLLAILMPIAFTASFTGSYLLTLVSNSFMKPLLLVILIVVAIYTFFKKNFGQQTHKNHTNQQQIIRGIVIAVVIGLYDGFVGPGTGSFLLLAFVSVLGFHFLQASAKAKMVNIATNLGSIVLFVLKGKIIWGIALTMGASNAMGGMLGAKFAMKKGNAFVRKFFLVVVTATLLRFAYDVFVAH
jgi:uncharacterized protein